MILMQAPAANLSFGVMPSGQTYVSDQNALIYITNNSTADQTALASFGCLTLTSISQVSFPQVCAQTADASTLAALPTCVYVNGTSGVGATLTASANGALTAQDGVTLTLNQHLLVRHETDFTRHGLYKLTTLGDSTHKFVLTRDNNMNEATEMSLVLVTVTGGSTLTGAVYYLPLHSSQIAIGSTLLPFIRAN
jgi:hypothetical protein